MGSTRERLVRITSLGVSIAHVLCAVHGQCTPAVADGPAVRYTQSTQESTDVITDSVSIKRGHHGCIYNANSQQEPGADSSEGGHDSGPAGTRWARGSYVAVGPDHGLAGSVYTANFCGMTVGERDGLSGSQWVMHATAEDLYFDVALASWSDGGDGRFAWSSWRGVARQSGYCRACLRRWSRVRRMSAK
jgi:hypothetical protein